MVRAKHFWLSLFCGLMSATSLAAHVQIQSMPVLDSDFACTDQAKANQYVSDFKIDITSFGGMELCNSKVDSKKLFNDLGLIEKGSFATNAQNNLIKGFLPADQYYSWMKSQTRGIARGQDVPYATAYNSGGYFTMQDGWTELSTLGRVGTVVHEARHTGGYVHIICQQGPYIKTSVQGCDSTYAYGGSHAIEMEYYARVSVAGQNFHPVYKKMARLMAIGRSNIFFNQTPLQQRETLMAISHQGRAYLLSKGKWVERETPQVGNRILKRTSFGGVLFNGSSALVLDPYENSGYAWSVVDDYSYFKMIKSPVSANFHHFDDFEEFDIGRKRYVVGLNDNDQMASYGFPKGVWSSFESAPRNTKRFATWSPNGDQGLFILDQSLKLFAVNPEDLSVQATNETWDPLVKNYARAQGGFYKLMNSGELTVTTQGQEKIVATPEAFDQVVAVPVYDAFEVKP